MVRPTNPVPPSTALAYWLPSCALRRLSEPLALRVFPGRHLASSPVLLISVTVFLKARTKFCPPELKAPSIREQIALFISLAKEDPYVSKEEKQSSVSFDQQGRGVDSAS